MSGGHFKMSIGHLQRYWTLIAFLCHSSATLPALFKRVPGFTKHPPKAAKVGSIRTVSGESISVDGLALIQVQFEQNVYPFCAHIIENLAIDAILGADFLSYY